MADILKYIKSFKINIIKYQNKNSQIQVAYLIDNLNLFLIKIMSS